MTQVLHPRAAYLGSGYDDKSLSTLILGRRRTRTHRPWEGVRTPLARSATNRFPDPCSGLPGRGPRDVIPPLERSWYPRANAGQRRPSGRARRTTREPEIRCTSPPSLCPWCLPLAAPRPQQRVQKLYVANSAGNDIHVIDTATNRVIKRVEVGPVPHGLVATANGDQIFITIENTKGDEGSSSGLIHSPTR